VAVLGLALLPLIALGLIVTGLPAFVVLIGVAGVGASVAAFAGETAMLGALPSRLIALLENDLLQALPLFVLMGSLVNRLPLADTLFRTGVRLVGGGRAAPQLAAIGIGALLAPMNGSVGASVSVLSRAVRPRLAATGVPPPRALATIAVASTLGVVVPPSLVLILLGDAMMAAHTIASNAAGRSDRILNTQDVFRGAIAPAALFVVLCLVIAAVTGRKRTGAAAPLVAADPVRAVEWLVAALTVAFIVAVLGGVAAGYFYAVEAAAMGAVTLLIGGFLFRRLDGATLRIVLDETLAITGALFALLVAATTFTLVIRGLGTDRLVAQLIADIPGGAIAATLVVLAIIAASAFALDAFEIIFVVVPVVMPALLMRVPDAIWVAVLTILTLQASFLIPPLGYAVLMARTSVAEPVSTKLLVRALLPFLIAQGAVLGATAAFPVLVHWRGEDRSIGTGPALSDRDVRKRFDDLAPEAPPPLGGFELQK
jgi:tripartite ATP-independent transporter DctM subunit